MADYHAAGGKGRRLRLGGLTVTLVFLLLLTAGCGSSPHELVDQPAPEFTLTLLSGQELASRELEGRPLLLEFWAPWCPGCLLNIPVLQELYDEYEGRVHIVAPSLERGRRAVEGFVRNRAITYPVALADQQLLNSYQASAIPLTVLIDQQGIIRYYHAGQLDREQMRREISRLL